MARARFTLLPLVVKLAVPVLLVPVVAIKASDTVALAIAPTLTTRLSLADRSVMVSVPASTVKVSLPAPPVRVSLPKPPFKTLAALLPVKMLFSALPVPLSTGVEVTLMFKVLSI